MGTQVPKAAKLSVQVLGKDPGVDVCPNKVHSHAKIHLWSVRVALYAFVAASGPRSSLDRAV